MTTTDATPTPPEAGDPTPEPDSRWATNRTHLEVDGDRTVTGRRVSGPVQGFGKLWQKTYRVRFEDVEATPEAVIARWRERYAEFWPKNSEFRSPLAGVAPGEIGLIATRVGGLKLSTGVLVLYADDTSFSFITPEGHPFAGLITFSAERDTDGTTAAQVQLLLRAHDPMAEIGMAFGGARKEDGIWLHTMDALARSFEVLQPRVDKQIVCVDKRRQWKRIGNLRHDAALAAVTRPFRR